MKHLKDNPWKTVKSTIQYDNNWIQVSHRDVINPSGNEGIYGVVHFKNIAIGIIPLDDENNTWLIGQYRYPLDEYSWEIPEGGGLHKDDPLDSAKRELKEETGMTADHWEKLLKIHISNSVTDEYGIVYLATGLSFGQPEPTDSEKLTIKKVPLENAYEMVMEGKITDSLSVAGLLKLKILMTGN